MTTQTLKRTFLRTHRSGMVMQSQLKRMRGKERNFRSPVGRELIASNMIYRRRYA